MGKLDRFMETLVDDDGRFCAQMLLISVLLSVVSLTMSVINLYTGEYALAVATILFSAVNFFNSVMIYRHKRVSRGSFLAFGASVVILFFYLIITGGAAGVSPIWACILPACGYLLLGMKRGLVITLITLAGIIFLMWTPQGGQILQYPYPPEFCSRFTVVYIAMMVVGLTLERIYAAMNDRLADQLKYAQKLSQTDLLTGIYNRRWYNEQLQKQNSQPEYRRRYAVIMIDVDKFKEVNDTYGHLHGDDVLIQIADVIRKAIAPGDIACRWGGDEFLCTVRVASEAGTASIAEGIRQKVEQLSFSVREGEHHSVTVSIGAVFVSKPCGVYSNEVFSMADDALYQAKKKGQNCVVVTTLHKNTENPEKSSVPV